MYSIAMIHVLSEQIEPCLTSSCLLCIDNIEIPCLMLGSGFRIISRLIFSSDGAKLSEKSLWEISSEEGEDKVFSCSPEAPADLGQ